MADRSVRPSSPYRAAVLLALMTIVCAVVPAAAQRGEATYYQIRYVEVRPDQWDEYKAAVMELIELFEQHERKYPMIARYHQDEMVVRFITPLDGLADLAELEAETQRIRKAAGPALEQIAARYRKASIASRTEVFRHRPDLSYAPEKPVPPVGEAQYHWVHYFYIKRDQIAEAENNARDFAELLRERNVNRPFDLFECIIGTDGLYLLTIPAASASELNTQTAIDRNLTENLRRRSLEAARDWITRESTNVPELSYTPAAADR